MNIRASIKIDEKQFKAEMLKEIKRIVNNSIPRIQAELNLRLPALLKKHFTADVQPITGNDFYALGVPTINDDLVSIIDAASNSFEVKIAPANLLKINIGILEKSHQHLLNLPEAYFKYSSAKGSGVLQWLRWILLEGGNTVVDGYEVNYTNSRFSRTGGALMNKGSFFQVPDNLQGVAGDNILTRAIQNINADLEKLVKQVLNNSIK
jgi:hypothetical protein